MKLALGWLLTAFAVHTASAATPDKCATLAKTAHSGTTITLAEQVAAGTFAPPGGLTPIDDIPAFCRVAGSTAPTADSDIKFEVWLPLKGWNGKFQGVGNGGLAGSIAYPALAEGLRRGYATASTDTGHTGGSGNFAVGHPEKVIDFGHRAIHEVALRGKEIVQDFYGKAPAHSYFTGCSNGGRAALMEAQRYPDDYDGIVAGAPANMAGLSRIVEIVNLDVSTIDALDPNLGTFKRNGGKLLHYHGQADPGLPHELSTDYFDSVERLAAAGDLREGARKTAEFYRLFIVPEMGHCGGGPRFNGAALTALENWVEHGAAPDRLVTPYNVKGVPQPERVLCPYPATAQGTACAAP